MKPSELLDSKHKCHSIDKKMINRYFYEDCVVGYFNSQFGVLILIKANKSYQWIYSYKVFFSQVNYPITRLSSTEQINQAINIMQNDGKIIQRTEWERYLVTAVMEAI